MAAATTTVAVLAKGVLSPDGPQRGSDWAPWPTSKPMRFAVISVTFDTGDYVAGGIACNVLGALTGWTRITGITGGTVMMNTTVPTVYTFADPNDGTAGSRKVTLNVLATGAAHATSALTAETIYATVIGY